MGFLGSTKMLLALALTLTFFETNFSFDYGVGTYEKAVPYEKAGPYRVGSYEKPAPYRVEPYEKATPYKVEPYEKAVPYKAEPYEKAVPYKVEPYEKATPYKVEPYEKATPYKVEPYEKAVPYKVEPYEKAVPYKVEPYEKATPYKVEPYEKATPYKVEPYEKAVPYKVEPYEKSKVYDNKCYAIISKSSGRALTIDKDKYRSVQYTFLNLKNQIFRVEHQYDNIYRFKSPGCGRYLTSNDDGLLLLTEQSFSNKQANTLWHIEENKEHAPSVSIKSKHDNECIEVEYAALDNNAPVKTNTCYNKLNQLWFIVPVHCDAGLFEPYSKPIHTY